MKRGVFSTPLFHIKVTKVSKVSKVLKFLKLLKLLKLLKVTNYPPPTPCSENRPHRCWRRRLLLRH